MAYVKGGSVVDGNLYVEGGLVVRNITTSSGAGGQIPTIEDGVAVGDYIIKFNNELGALNRTALKENETSDGYFISTDKNNFAFKLNGSTGSNTEVLETHLNGGTLSLTLNSEPLNIQVTKTIKVQGMINGSKKEIPDTFTDDIGVDTAITSIPTEFLY